MGILLGMAWINYVLLPGLDTFALQLRLASSRWFGEGRKEGSKVWKKWRNVWKEGEKMELQREIPALCIKM